MKFQRKLPHSVAQSLQLKEKDPGPLVKARAHERRAETARADDESKAHLEYLERWRALEHTVAPIEERARREWSGKLAVDDMRPHEVIGHLIASLPRPRQDAIFGDRRIGELNAALHKRNLRRIVEDNELLQELRIDWNTFLDAKRDLKFQLGIQTYRSAQALACYLTLIRAACDPKVRKTANLVTDGEILTLAKDILRDVTTHIIEQMQSAHDTFFDVANRRATGEQFRVDRAKKSGRAVPAADAPKGRSAPPVDPKRGPAKKAPPGGLKA